jgi:hypothetical protein
MNLSEFTDFLASENGEQVSEQLNVKAEWEPPSFVFIPVNCEVAAYFSGEMEDESR